MNKAWILRVGRIVRSHDGNSYPQDWVMDGYGVVPAVQILDDGTMLVGGWSMDELREIVTRPAEFVEIELPCD